MGTELIYNIIDYNFVSCYMSNKLKQKAATSMDSAFQHFY